MALARVVVACRDFFPPCLACTQKHHPPPVFPLAATLARVLALADMRALLLVGYSSNMMAQINLLGRILVEFVSIWSVIAMFLGFFAWFGESPPAKLTGSHIRCPTWWWHVAGA